jgi:hypothetical protein
MITVGKLTWIHPFEGERGALPKTEQDWQAVFAGQVPAGYAFTQEVVGQGATLQVTGRDERIMSDVWEWATYVQYIDAAGRTKEVWLAYSGYGKVADGAHFTDTHHVVFDIDATEEAKARKAAFDAKVARLAEVERKIKWMSKVEPGKEVKVVRGRKVPQGTEGKLFWIGADKFNRHGTRVGIKDAAGTVHWTAGSNVEVKQPAEYADYEAEYQALAAEIRA